MAVTDILAELADLHKQATTERSHYYTGKVVAIAMTEIAILRLALQSIAHGRRDNARPLGAEYARECARETLDALNVDWKQP